MSEQISLIPAVPAGLRQASKRGNLILFIGAGASQVAGCPGWEGFANGALDWLIAEGKFSYSQLDQIKHLNPRLKLSLARTLATKSGLAIDFRGLLHPKPRKELSNGIKLYSNLFKLANVFVTTNYDEWLDERIVDESPSARPDTTIEGKPSVGQMKVIHKKEDLLPAALNGSNTVVHLHGSLLDATGMILTTLDYLKHYANDRRFANPESENRVLTFLEHLFKFKTVLFIGFGLQELEILEYVISKAQPQAPSSNKEIRHYILQGFYSHQDELKQKLESYYLEFGIQLIPFLLDMRNFEQLIEVVEDFAKHLPASSPLVSQTIQEMEDLLNG
jgi:hypothetical protein